VSAVGEERVGEVLAQLAPEVPLAEAVFRRLVAEDRLDRTRECALGVRDDHARRALERAEERLPGGLVPAPERLQAPEPGQLCPVPGGGRCCADRGQDLEAAAGVLA
jgi:hypothetical protein